ncbi:MAG: hypothetical protein DRH37_05060 [Deltaproteobacteria bacterium]|nr:MAG: hypothetical protein B5M55_06950 [Desulfococcus sp. 4484_242]RLC30582.1 MAG: hypothetical protein DRH37_05060 [Deltaproteobacteria bacterium]
MNRFCISPEMVSPGDPEPKKRSHARFRDNPIRFRMLSLAKKYPPFQSVKFSLGKLRLLKISAPASAKALAQGPA